MKILPQGKWARLRLGVLVVVLFWACLQFHAYGLGHRLFYQPKAGDIVFQSLPDGPLVAAIEGITQSPFSHCGVVMQNRDGHWVVYEAIGMVRETPLYLWITRGRGARLDVWRWRELASHNIADLQAALDQYLGKPYDFLYAPEDNEIYCSELVFKAYRHAYQIELGTWEPLGDLNWKPFESFIRQMDDGNLPLDRPMITPVAITRSLVLQKVY